MISFNTVYQHVSNGEQIRIIYVDYKHDICAYVFLFSNLSIPIITMLTDLEHEYNSNHLVMITDPFLLMKKDKDLTSKEISKRNESWKIIEKYWEPRKNDFLSKSKRMGAFREIADTENISLMTVRRIFSRFWQRGMNRNALLPDYAKSGGKGKEKNLKEKNGRRRIYCDSETGGIIITEEIKKQFEVATEKYWRTGQKKPLRQVYRHLLSDFYSIKTNKNSEVEKIIKEAGSIPTFDQFYYWFKKNENTILDIKTRESERQFNLKNRSLLSNSTIEASGPGFRYQIDATIADLYIVSEINRNMIIGRPTVYIIIDVFSRMITGVYVGLESPSWNGAMMVLDSMIEDKVKFCRKYNIDINEEDWPCCHLPEIIIADRGEMEGHAVENLINNLNITIENTPPYRGDYKGIVERFFRTINERIENNLPGAIMKDYRKRGDPDYRLEAKLTLKEISEIIIRCVLLHNIKEIEKYPLTPEMIGEGIKPTPLDLWNWGIANKKGTLRKIDQQRFRLNILPRGKATISRGSVVFNKLNYSAAELLDDALYQRNKLKKLEIVYDPRNIKHIYWLKDDGIQYITLNLLERSCDFKDMYLEDVIFANKEASSLRQEARKTQLQHEADLDQAMIKISKQASKETKLSTTSNISKSKKLKNIKTNRAEEKERNRQEEAFTPLPAIHDELAENVRFEEQVSEQSEVELEMDYNARMMKKIRERKEKAKK